MAMRGGRGREAVCCVRGSEPTTSIVRDMLFWVRGIGIWGWRLGYG